ncbi:hypothetical protein HanRHA438_Chr07g0292881 [Helianthus annuus]|nr:hypothetical protein HanRHA438_Chr07g0292881 [Helianthus annuus]
MLLNSSIKPIIFDPIKLNNGLEHLYLIQMLLNSSIKPLIFDPNVIEQFKSPTKANKINSPIKPISTP